jgi:hypothetical protein
MLPHERAPIRRPSLGLPPAVLAGLLATLTSACSTLPDSVLPEHQDHTFHASYVIGSDGRLVFPSTTRNLIIRQIHLTPKPLSEQFELQRRWFVYPAGTTVHARGQLRAYASPSGDIPELGDLLPNAKLHQD